MGLVSLVRELIPQTVPCLSEVEQPTTGGRIEQQEIDGTGLRMGTKGWDNLLCIRLQAVEEEGAANYGRRPRCCRLIDTFPPTSAAGTLRPPPRCYAKPTDSSAAAGRFCTLNGSPVCSAVPAAAARKEVCCCSRGSGNP